MLVQNVYSVFDLKGETFSQPFFSATDASAMRLFGDAILDRETPVGRHPEDYALFRVGVWNADNGSMAGTDVPIPVWTGLEAMKRRELVPLSELRGALGVPGKDGE